MKRHWNVDFTPNYFIFLQTVAQQYFWWTRIVKKVKMHFFFAFLDIAERSRKLGSQVFQILQGEIRIIGSEVSMTISFLHFRLWKFFSEYFNRKLPQDSFNNLKRILNCVLLHYDRIFIEAYFKTFVLPLLGFTDFIRK